MKKLSLFMSILCLALMVVGCGDKTDSSNNVNDDSSKNPGIEKNEDDKNQGDKTEDKKDDVDKTEDSDEEVDESFIKVEVYNYVVDFWNDCFCDVYHYVESGTDACGEEMDIDATIEKGKGYYNDLGKYDDMVAKLDKEANKDFIETWENEKAEINKLYTRITEEKPRPEDSSYEFDYEKFQELMYELLK